MLCCYLIFVIRPAAIVVPSTRNITLPNCLISLYNSIQIGFCIVISIIALEFFGKQRGFFFIISLVVLWSCAINLVITPGWTKDCWWITIGRPFIIGTFTVNTTICAWKHNVTGTGFWGLQIISPIPTFCWSIPDNVKETWSPANAFVIDISSICKSKISFYNLCYKYLNM